MRMPRLAAIGLAGFSSALAACAQMPGGGPGQGHMWNMPYGGLPLTLLLIVIVVFAVLMFRGRGPGGRSGEDPMDILKRRYARGEIDREEFERMRKELGGD